MRPTRRLKGRWAALTGTGAAASVSLGLLVFFCVFVAVAGPRDSLGVRTHAFRQLLSAAPVTSKSVAATLDFTTFASALGGQVAVSDLTAARDELAAKLAKARVPLARGASWSGLSSAYARVSGAGPRVESGCAPPEMEVLYRDRLSHYARLVSGRLPGGPVSGQPATLQVAVTPATAARFGLRPGSRLGMDGTVLLVTGIVRPVSPGSPFWTLDPDAAAPTQNSCGHTTAATYWLGAAFVGQAGMPTLLSRLNTFRMQLTWDFPLDATHLTADQAPALENELTNGLTQAGQLVTSTNGQPTLVTMSSGLAGVVAVFIQEDRAVGSVLSLLYVSLTVIGAVAVLLGARLVADHRSGEFAVMRARGASLRQLAWVALRGGAAVTLPAALAGAALAGSLTPGAGEPLEWWLGGAVVLVALAGLPLIVVYANRAADRASRQRPRRGPSRRRAAARRLVAEVTAIALAVGGLIVLREQGPHTAGSDIYARAAPVLVAIPAAIVVMRCYPVVVRWLMRLAGARPGVTAYVGLARSSRGPRTAMLPIFALILGLAVVAFGAMVRAAVVRGEVAASWHQTGADAVIDASGSYLPFGAAAQRTITAVPGVERAATVLVTTGSPANSGALAVAGVNPDRYAALIADTPAPRFPAAALAQRHAGPGNPGTVPALATRAAAYQIGRGSTVLQIGTLKLTIRVVGTVNSVPGVAGPAVVVLPYWAFGAKPPPPTLMLVIGPHLDGPKLVSVAQRALPSATVTLRSQALTELAGAPLPRGGSIGLTAGAAAAAGLILVILLITLVLSARSRELTLARMAAMGLSQEQARWLVVAETLPLIVAAIVGGVASAWALASLIGPSISLSAFTGTSAAVPVRAEPTPLAAAAVGLMAVAFAALAIQTVIAGRRGVARTLRME